MTAAMVTEEQDRSDVEAVDAAELWIARSAVHRRRRQCLLLIAVLIMMSVGYVLSPAVLIVLDKHGLLPPAAEPIVEIAILPLEWTYDRSEVVRSFYEGYFELIGVDE